MKTEKTGPLYSSFGMMKKELNRYVKFKKKMKNKNAEVCKRLWMLKDKLDY